jgi:hypothetical protein
VVECQARHEPSYGFGLLRGPNARARARTFTWLGARVRQGSTFYSPGLTQQVQEMPRCRSILGYTLGAKNVTNRAPAAPSPPQILKPRKITTFSHFAIQPRASCILQRAFAKSGTRRKSYMT